MRLPGDGAGSAESGGFHSMKCKKTMAVLLALAMVFALLPASVQADGESGTMVIREGQYLEEVMEGWYAENHGTVGTNNGTVIENDGTVNTNNGTVTTNNGTVASNSSLGKVEFNYGTVEHNYGRVAGNLATSDQDYGYITYNEEGSMVGDNRGCVYLNDGTVANNYRTVEGNRNRTITNTQNGTVGTNWRTVDTNYGTIGTNDNYYGEAVVSANYGTVQNNKSGAVVKNQTNGVVTTNSGEVYNYGGTVGSNTGTGTEYFTVSIVNNTAHTAVSSSGLKNAYGAQWLGHASTATVTLTPANGYEINQVTGLPTNVTAAKNANGTWTLTVSGGSHTTINVPEATDIPLFTVTVNNGTGGGRFAEGASVTITANAPETGMIFAGWTGADGLTFTEGDTSTATATFIMPASNVTVSADFITQWTWLQQQLEEDGADITLDRDIVCIDQDEGPLVVPEDTHVTLDLNGHTVDRNLTEPTENGNVITVKGELTLRDSSTEQTGVITGGNNLKDGGGVLVRGEESFGDEGSFIMEGGTITGNTARDGGGVSVGYLDTDTWDFFYGHFEMYGGVITGNLAATEEQYYGYGGGVYVGVGQFCLYGGEISENHAVLYGGGVYVVFGMSSAPFVVSGAPVVRDNTWGDVPETDNVAIEHWGGDCVITIGDEGLDPEASIGVNVYTIEDFETMEKIPYLESFTSGLSDNGGSASNFVSDSEGYTVVLNEDGEAMLAEVSEPKFATHSLVLSGKIGVNFFMDLRGLSDEERVGTYMTFEITGAGEVSAEPVYFDAGQMNSDQLYYGFTCYVTSIQMADTITATFHYGDDQTVSETYSIAQYIQSFEAVADQYDDTTVALVRALADYGHYVQAFLAEQKGWTLGEDGDYAEMDRYYTVNEYGYDDIADSLSEKAISRVFNDENIVKAPYTVVLDSDTAIRVYFTPAAGFNGDVSARMPGYQDEAYLERGSDGRYTVEIANIPAHLLGETYNIFVFTGENCFNDIYTMHTQVNVSAMSYVYAMLTSQAYANNELAKNAVSSLYAYWQAAVAYKDAHPEN